MINWIKEKPAECIDLCLVIYKDDYEFARFDGENWRVYINNEFCDAQEPIEYYAALNMPQ